MKQVQAIQHNISGEVVGKVTLKPRNVFARANYIYICNDFTSIPKGYKCVISFRQMPLSNNCTCVTVQDISLFAEGDVVSVNDKGEICWLYDINATSNAVFTTERCNHRCIMCPQPPIATEHDRTDFNLQLIKLFDTHSKESGITGGEPTMIGDRLFEIICQIQKSCPKAAISMLSNGVKFADKDYASKLALCRHHDLQIDIPIFSDIASEHNRIVGANTFYKTVQGLYNLAVFGQRIGLRIVIHKQTYKRLPQLADYIYHNFPFVTQVAFMQMETTGLAAKNLKDLWIDPFDYNKELEQAVLLLQQRGIRPLIFNAQLCVLPESLRCFATQSISEWKDIYLPECEDCALKSQCGGLFASNKQYHSRHIKAHKDYTPMPEPIQSLEENAASNFMIDFYNERHRSLQLSSAIDVPCGYGRNAIWLAKNGVNVAAYDIDGKTIDALNNWILTHKTSGTITAIKANILNLNVEKSMFVVNVHLYSDELLDKLITLLQDNGILLIETPTNTAGNYLELPKAKYVYNTLIAHGFEMLVYKESPAKEGKVSVRTIAKKLSISNIDKCV